MSQYYYGVRTALAAGVIGLTGVSVWNITKRQRVLGVIDHSQPVHDMRIYVREQITPPIKETSHWGLDCLEGRGYDVHVFAAPQHLTERSVPIIRVRAPSDSVEFIRDCKECRVCTEVVFEDRKDKVYWGSAVAGGSHGGATLVPVRLSMRELYASHMQPQHNVY